MSTTQAILKSYRAPQDVMRTHLAQGAGEERALAWVMIACVLFFVAQLPRLSREAHLNPEGPPLEALAGGAFMGTVLVAPLIFYGLAALSRIVAKLFGGRGSWLRARLALFWGLMAVTPLVLLQGLVAGFVGEGAGLSIVSLLAFAMFLYIWIRGLIFVERAET